MYNSNFEKQLRKQASEFLICNYFLINGVKIYPKEIEVYYYEQGIFEDYTVHRNRLQENNKNGFYVHRRGHEASSPIIESNRGGCDFVISDRDGVFHSYLIRSIVIDGELVVGPCKSLKAILRKTGLSYKELEESEVSIISSSTNNDVFMTSRIGLGDSEKEDSKSYKDAKLRFILCDEYFKQRDKSNVGYPKRTEAIDDYLRNKIDAGSMTKEQAADYSRKWYGAASKEFK